jgi:hypothetical protein
MTDTSDRARRLLPLHDDTVPIVCTIGEDEKADRVAMLDHMRRALIGLERTEHGLLLELPRGDGLDADVRRFARDEKRCCQFWGFAVVEGDDTLVLRWDGPDAAASLLDTIAGVLRSDAPIESIDGLL